jgi:hypothetical protein
MADVIAAIDEAAANALLHDAESALGTIKAPGGSTSSGPLVLQWSASASFSGGTVTLTPADVVAIDNCTINYQLGADVGIDLSFLDFCLPQVCVPIPCVGEVCTPEICLTFPTISLPLSFSSSATFSAQFELEAALVGGEWEIDVVILGLPQLDLGPAATALLEAITLAIAAALAAIPFIGPVLALATTAIAAAFGIAEATGLLGDALTPLLSGLRFNLYKQPQHFEAIPAGGPLDPAVFVNLQNLHAEVQDAGKPELVVSVDI